jgi:CO/xanthine dehydrogenase Mo-binding subunit
VQAGESFDYRGVIMYEIAGRTTELGMGAIRLQPGWRRSCRRRGTPGDPEHQWPHARESILTNNPTFVGDPILAVAAVDETTAADALEKIKVEFEPLPFTVDPRHAGGLRRGAQVLRPDGLTPGARRVIE